MGKQLSGSLRSCLRNALGGYARFISNSTGEIRHAGVMTCISQVIASTGGATAVGTPPELQGYISHVTLALPRCRRTHVVGVYVPVSDTQQGAIASRATERLAKYITQLANTASAKGEPVLLGGDLNGDFATG